MTEPSNCEVPVEGALAKKVLKGTHWLLLQNPKKLNE